MVPEKPKTLAEILQYLDAIDQGIVNPTPQEQAELGALLVEKVDNTAEFLSELEFQAKRLREAEVKLAKGRRAIEAKVERLHGYMKFHMQHHGFTQIPGEVWKLRLSKSESVEVTGEPDPDRFPEYVRTKHEWDKAALKTALKSGSVIAAGIARLAQKSAVQIEVNKGKLG